MVQVGNTPLWKLNRLVENGMADVWVKWEGANPTGSLKDRMALAMVNGALARGDLAEGGELVEYTGGSTGSSLAMICATMGIRATFVTHDLVSPTKIATMRAFGATVEVVKSEGTITKELIGTCIGRVGEFAAETGAFRTDQFNNPDNRAGYEGMANEILNQLDGKVDGFVQCVGTGGSFSGCAGVFKAANPACRCHPIEPSNSQVIAGLAPTGGHGIEGVGAGFVPSIFRHDVSDGAIAIADDTAFEMTRQLAPQEGMFAGASSGANVHVALQLARELGPGHNVVTLLCDTGLKYLNCPPFGAASLAQ